VASVGAFTGFGEGGLFSRLSSSGSFVPGSESDQVEVKTSDPDEVGAVVTLVVSGVNVTTQGAEITTFLNENRSLLEVEGVESVVDPFLLPPGDPRGQALVSTKSGFAMPVTLEAGLSDTALDAARDDLDAGIISFRAELTSAFPDASINALSGEKIVSAINHQVEQDLVRGEALGLPVALLLMVLVFGGLIAAGLPLLGAVTAIGVGMGALWGLTFALEVDSFILNVVSVIGLALSIDYGLLVVSRFREEAARLAVPGAVGVPRRATEKDIVRLAVQEAVTTAGRTVVFSAVTIACAIAGLLVMQSTMLRLVGVGGVIVVILAVLTAVTLVPALLTLGGVKMLGVSPVSKIPGLRRLLAMVSDHSSDEGFFSRLAAWVHRRPWPVIVVVTAILAIMASPIASLNLRSNFAEYIPEGEVRTAYQALQTEFPALATPSLIVLAKATPEDSAPVVEKLQALPGATFVSQPTSAAGDPAWSRIDVRIDAADQVGNEVTDLVKQLRATDNPPELLVGGPAALQYDFARSLLDDAPLALLIVAISVLVLLFLLTGSAIVPIKALIINVFSLLASLGTTAWLFEHGHLGLPQTPGMETFVVACALAFGFGLAMDYEVFLLARIKEYWDAGYDNEMAVERGLQRSGRIITSAAAIIIAVFLGFVAGDMIAIKQVGVALAIVVVTDATLVRMLLVPATMTILGKWNWWSPTWMQRLYARFGIVH
ncbi:MAG TPA: MMPL family transporter, partial [Propionibacteriaceae bacterium]|nr:MMPL family transporter [Propionibacteriaceae bacterium]